MKETRSIQSCRTCFLNMKSDVQFFFNGHFDLWKSNSLNADQSESVTRLDDLLESLQNILNINWRAVYKIHMKSAEKPHEPHVLWIGFPLSWQCRRDSACVFFCIANYGWPCWVMPWLVFVVLLYSDRGCMPACWVSQSGHLTGNLPIHTTGFCYRSHNFMPCQQPLWPVPNRAGWLGGARRDPRFLKMVFSCFFMFSPFVTPVLFFFHCFLSCPCLRFLSLFLRALRMTLQGLWIRPIGNVQNKHPKQRKINQNSMDDSVHLFFEHSVDARSK